MTAKRRNKLRKLAEEIPVPEVFGDQEGDTLLVGWGSTYGPIHDAVKMGREHGEKIGAIHLRHVHPLPNGLEKIFANFERVVTVEMNDQAFTGSASSPPFCGRAIANQKFRASPRPTVSPFA